MRSMLHRLLNSYLRIYDIARTYTLILTRSPSSLMKLLKSMSVRQTVDNNRHHTGLSQQRPASAQL